MHLWRNLICLVFFTKSTLEGPSSRQRAHRCTPAWYPSQLKRPHRKDNPLITFEKETYEYKILQYQAMSEAAGLIADHLSIAWRRAAATNHATRWSKHVEARWLLDAAWMAIWGGLHSKVYKGVPPCAACMSTQQCYGSEWIGKWANEHSGFEQWNSVTGFNSTGRSQKNALLWNLVSIRILCSEATPTREDIL